MKVIRIIGIIVIGGFILSLMWMAALFCGKPPEPFRIVGFNGPDFIYENPAGEAFEKEVDGHYTKIGK
jgi:hypothetical protein